MGTVLSIFALTPKKLGSQEVFAHELSLQLAERGWRSVLSFEAAPPDDVADYLAVPNASLEIIECPEELRWSALVKLVSAVWRHRPDIIHLNYVGFLSFYPWLARLCGVRNIYFTDHTSRPASHVAHRAPLWKRLLTRLINWPLTGVVCVSRYGRDCMTALDVFPTERFHVIYNGVDTTRSNVPPGTAAGFRRKYGIPDERSIVVQVSWMRPEKGVQDLLAAAELVLQVNRDVHFVLVGDGTSRDEYIRLAARLGIQDHCTWTGLVQDPFREGVYAAADIVCQVSRWEEVFGLTIAEAMASRRPVIATRVGGIPELIDDGQPGFLVPCAAPTQLADRILSLLTQPTLRSRLGEAGYHKAAVHFDLTRNTARLLELYRLPAQPSLESWR